MLEDSVAVVGVGVAGVAVTATYVTGDPVYDAIGSIAVGGMLVRVDLNPALVLALTLSRTLARTLTLQPEPEPEQVGGMLGAVAVFIINRNRAFLGGSVPPRTEQVRRMLQAGVTTYGCSLHHILYVAGAADVAGRRHGGIGTGRQEHTGGQQQQQ